MRLTVSFIAGIAVILCLRIATPAAEAPTRIRIAYPPSGTIISAQVGLTMEKTDILRKNGFAPELFAMSNGRDMKIALVSDKVDVIMTSEANFVVLLAEGFEAYGIASLGAGGNMGLAVRTGSGIQKIEQLRGKTVATIFGTSLHRPAIDWTSGIPDVKIVSMPNIGAMVTALESGKIDAAILWDPHMTDCVSRGTVKVLRQEPLELIAIASKKFVDDHPGALERFQKAFREAVFYFVQHKSEVNRCFSDTSKVDMKLIEQIARTNRNYDKKRLDQIDIRISPSFIDKMKKTGLFLYRNNIIMKNPAIDNAIYNPK
jgi:ABC-type nitrate/sulfonate/bicarbonate transport system substrate-binding protein